MSHFNQRRMTFLKAIGLMTMALVLFDSIQDQAKAQTAEKNYQQIWTTLDESTQDGIIANVGGEILLFSDLRRAINLASQGQADLLANGSIIGSGISPAQAQEVFEKLVEQTILELKVEELSLEVTESELDDEIGRFLESRQISRSDFLKMLESEGESEQSHRTEFKRQLETQRFIGRMIRPLVSITDEEVRSYYLSERPGKEKSQERLVLRSLVINNTQSGPEKVTAVQEALASGMPFEEAVTRFSDAPDAKVKGGLLDAKKPAELPPAVAQALGNESPGKTMGPLAIGSSTFFFQLVSRESAAETAFSSEKEKWSQKLLERKFAERLQSYLEAERDKVKISMRPIQFKN